MESFRLPAARPAGKRAPKAVAQAVARPVAQPAAQPAARTPNDPIPVATVLLNNSASSGVRGWGDPTPPRPSDPDFIVGKHEILQKEISIWAVFGTQTFGLLGSRDPPPLLRRTLPVAQWPSGIERATEIQTEPMDNTRCTPSPSGHGRGAAFLDTLSHNSAAAPLRRVRPPAAPQHPTR